MVAAPETTPPFAVEAVVAEEDTYLVLSTPAELPEVAEHPIRVMTALFEARGEEPGSVVVKEGRPLRLLAIVHDLAADPTWKEEWVEGALVRVLDEVRRRGIRSLALPFLATRHGKLEPERFLVLLCRALASREPGVLERLWLMS